MSFSRINVISGRLILSAANTSTEKTLHTPVVRSSNITGGRVRVIELIKLFVDMPELDLDGASATNRSSAFAVQTVGGTAPSFTALFEPQTMALIRHSVRNAFTAAGTAMLELNNDPHVWDFTDGAGTGLIMSTSELNFIGNSSGFTGAAIFDWKLYYRFVEIGLDEYVGIVQQQTDSR